MLQAVRPAVHHHVRVARQLVRRPLQLIHLLLSASSFAHGKLLRRRQLKQVVVLLALGSRGRQGAVLEVRADVPDGAGRRRGEGAVLLSGSAFVVKPSHHFSPRAHNIRGEELESLRGRGNRGKHARRMTFARAPRSSGRGPSCCARWPGASRCRRCCQCTGSGSSCQP